MNPQVRDERERDDDRLWKAVGIKESCEELPALRPVCPSLPEREAIRTAPIEDRIQMIFRNNR